MTGQAPLSVGAWTDGDGAAAADALRHLALDEGLKAAVAADDGLRDVAWRVARRYVAGRTLAEVLVQVVASASGGHRVTVDHMGESTRDAGVAERATAEFLRLVEAIAAEDLPCSVSLDLSHLGSELAGDVGLRNVERLAEATADAGIELMLSMEGHDRTDAILAAHDTLSRRHDHVGVTVQARLHRTPGDLERLLDRPGRIRLVKGAYDVPDELAVRREDPQLLDTYDELAARLLRSGHPCSLATHDVGRLTAIDRLVRTEALHSAPYQVEMLDGIAPGLLTQMRGRGHPTQNYLVYGTQWWLYVCNRLAEDPQRLLLALTDAVQG